ncbi:hypothetical protein PVAND_002848 [Polypedilum vanderplanki]|uniref:Secreted protein n=1 Tax=Polypedilum vanderplanki TaxID=319348 RepID=A0A9J6BSD4_POLVA|nr:hypothetical protein PVAND_002848 [Polypedilum vanderplanki]
MKFSLFLIILIIALITFLANYSGAYPVIQMQGSSPSFYIYEKPNKISVTVTQNPLRNEEDDDNFTTEYPQENFDDDDDISSSVIATLVG